MSFTSCWLSSSSSGFLSDVDTLGLAIPNNCCVQWLWGVVTTSSVTPTTIITFTIPSTIATDCSFLFEYQYGTIGDGLATDNSFAAFNMMTQVRVAGSMSTTAPSNANIMTGGTPGTLPSLGTVTFGTSGSSWQLKVTASDTKNQKWWMFCKIVGVYE